jgi:hypothetical protein
MKRKKRQQSWREKEDEKHLKVLNAAVYPSLRGTLSILGYLKELNFETCIFKAEFTPLTSQHYVT